MPVAPASLANLRPWNSQTARLVSPLGVKARKQTLTTDLANPELQVDSDRQLLKAQLTKVKRKIAQTQNPLALLRLVTIQERLMKQIGHQVEPTKPIPKITLRLP